MSLPPLPAPPPARPALVVLGLVGAICSLQVIAILAVFVHLAPSVGGVLGSLFTIVLVGLFAAYHFERKKYGMMLTRSELRYRMLAQERTDFIVVLGATGTTPHTSAGLTALLGYTPEELVGIPIRDFIDPEDRLAAKHAIATLSRTIPRGAITLKLRHKSGSKIWAEAKLCRIEQADGLSETVVTIQDVTGRHREAEELRQATLSAQRAQAEADKANTAKTEFLAHMSHEIRTPLNSVIGFAGLLLTMPDLPTKVRLHVERIQGGGNALLTVVNDILDFSQVEAGRLELAPAPFSLPGLVDECLSLVQPSAVAKHLSVHVNLVDRLPVGVLGDSARLRQILLNLLNNAIKFTREGSVLLDIRYDRASGVADAMKFSVIDTGIGIADEDRHRLFQRFAQVDASIQRNYGGTGLGLAICKRLVALMDGQIGIESEYGVGSTFWFSLPLPPAALPLQDMQPLQQPIAPRPVTILLVDDVAINQDLVRHVLEATGHTVDVVCNGAEAIMAVQDRNYDVVLMDVQMPHIDGLAATRIIRSLSHTCRDVPIVAMTANVLPEQIALAREAGMVDVIHKPFSAAQIHATLTRIVGTPASASDIPGGGPDMSSDAEILIKLAKFIGDAKVKSLLAGLATSLSERFEGDPMTPEGRATLKRQAHASVAGSGMLGFTGFAATCKAFEHAPDDGDFAARTTALRAQAGSVVDHAMMLSSRKAPLADISAAA